MKAKAIKTTASSALNLFIVFFIMFQLCLCIRVIGYKVTYFRKNNKTLKMQLSEELIVKNKEGVSK